MRSISKVAFPLNLGFLAIAYAAREPMQMERNAAPRVNRIVFK
jgi:hypothetical protein